MTTTAMDVNEVNNQESSCYSDGIYDYVDVEPHRLVYTVNYPIRMISNNVSSTSTYSNTYHHSQQEPISGTTPQPVNRSRSSSTHSNNSPSSSSLSNYHTNILLHNNSNNNSPRNISPRSGAANNQQMASSSSPPHQITLSSTFQQQSFHQYQQVMAPTFSAQLPIPPGSNLFKIRSSLSSGNNSKLEKSEMESEIFENVKILQNFNSEEKIPIRIGFTKKNLVDAEKEENRKDSVKPYNSVKLYESSLGYVYEDHWNVEGFRPLLNATLISPSVSSSNEKIINSEVKSEEKLNESETNPTETIPETNDDSLKSNPEDKSKWRTRILEKYPVMQEIQERIYPLWRTVSFGELYNAGQKQVRENLTEDVVLNILMQHLRFEGLKKTISELEKETKRKYLDIDVQQSLLHSLAKEAVKKTERLHDLVIFDKFQHSNAHKNKNSLMKALEERLNDLGINEYGHVTESEKENLSKWKEIVGGQNEIVHVDPVKKYEQFQAGTLNRIIEKLTSFTTDQQNSLFVDVFLHTYHSLIQAETVLNRLIQKCKNLPKNHSQESKNNIQAGILKFLHYWMEQHSQHFTNNMIGKVQKLLNQENNSSPKFIKLRRDILQLIEDGQLFNLKKNQTVSALNYIEPKVPMQKIFCETLSLDDIDEEEIARQLTLYEYDLFVAIGLEELMSFGWKRLKFKHRCPNINNLLIHFEHVTKWISFSICKPKSKNPIKRYISICEHLKKLNNFNTLKAVLNAFEFGEVKTLKIGQSEQSAKSKLQQLMSEESNYQEYRQTLKESSEENSSIIPYVRVHLRDLFLVEENQNDFVSIGPNSIEFINWMKRESMYDIVKEIKHFQSLPCYQFTKVYQIQELIRNIQIE